MPPPIPSRFGPDRNLDLARHRAELLAVDRVREGDALALELIFTAYRAELLLLARRIVGAPEMAEEVVQDVFLSIWAGRARWHITTSLKAYLRRAVHNAATRAGMSHARRSAGALELSEAELLTPAALADPAATPDVALERTEFAAALDQATRALSPRARDVLTLKRVHQLSNREIAGRLGLSVKTVETHVTRALAALRRALVAWRT